MYNRDLFKNLTLFDDIVSKIFFRDIKCVQVLLEKILDREFKIIEHRTQVSLDNPAYKSIICDVLVKFDDDRYVNVEIQKDNNPGLIKRSRYYTSSLDTHLLKKGDDYKSLPDTKIIFLMPMDIFKKSRTIYRIQRKFEDNEIFPDGNEIIFVNAENNTEDALWALMQDFLREDYKDMKNQIFRERMKELKTTEKGDEEMSTTLQTLIAEREEIALEKGREEGIEKGREEGLINVALRLLNMGFGDEEISLGTGLSIEKINEIKKTVK